MSSYDIIFLNECWIPEKVKLELSGYTLKIKARKRKKNARRDSGGLCVLIKNSIADFFEFVEWNNEDGMIVKVKCQYTSINKDLYFVFVYMRSNNSTRNDLTQEYDAFDLLYLKICELRENNEIVIIGDFNSRTSSLNDFYTNEHGNFDPLSEKDEIDYRIDQEFLTLSQIQLIRNNEDKKTNDFGHKLINLCQVSGMLICNGRINGDNNSGKFTYIDKKGKSTNDYALISKGLIKHDNEFYVNEPNIFSDHVPIVLKLCNINLKTFIPIFVEQPCDQISATNNYYKWEPDYLNVFQNNMNDDYVCCKLCRITDTLNKDTGLFYRD